MAERTVIGLTALATNHPPPAPRLNHRRAVRVIAAIDEILRREAKRQGDQDRDFVELGRHLCEVRAQQHWRVEGFESFDAFPIRDAKPIT